MENLKIKIKITVLGKKIRKLDSRKIVRIRIINGIMGEKKIFLYLFIQVLRPYAALRL